MCEPKKNTDINSNEFLLIKIKKQIKELNRHSKGSWALFSWLLMALGSCGSSVPVRESDPVISNECILSQSPDWNDLGRGGAAFPIFISSDRNSLFYKGPGKCFKEINFSPNEIRLAHKKPYGITPNTYIVDHTRYKASRAAEKILEICRSENKKRILSSEYRNPERMIVRPKEEPVRVLPITKCEKVLMDNTMSIYVNSGGLEYLIDMVGSDIFIASS